MHGAAWESSIVDWQNNTLKKEIFKSNLDVTDNVLRHDVGRGHPDERSKSNNASYSSPRGSSSSGGGAGKEGRKSENLDDYIYGDFYNYHLFNELYFLVDGGLRSFLHNIYMSNYFLYVYIHPSIYSILSFYLWGKCLFLIVLMIISV